MVNFRTLVLASTALFAPCVALAQSIPAIGVPFSTLSLGTTAGTAADASKTVGPIINAQSYSGVDPTGATSSSAGIQSALNAACAATPGPKTLYFPPGVYDFAANITQPSGCNYLTVEGEPNATKFIADATNVSTALIWLVGTNHNHITFKNLIFDGNVSNVGTSNTGGILRFLAPVDHIKIDNASFQNAPGNGAWLVGAGGYNATVSGTQAAYQSTLTLTGNLSGLNPGAYLYNSEVDPDIYVQSVSGSVVTLNKPLTDTLLTGSAVHFTPAFQIGANANYGTLSLTTSNTSELSIGQTVWSPSGCLLPKTHIVSVSTNTSVTLDQPVQCLLSSGSNLAAIGGVQDVVVQNSRFENLGEELSTSGSATYTTASDTPSGATISYNCLSAGCNPSVGLIPGNLSAATAQGGLPANDPIISQSVNTSAGTFSVTYANPVTADVPAATSLSHQVQGLSGNGYAIWEGNGAWFANVNTTLLNNYYRHTYSSPLFIASSSNVLSQGETFDEDWQEFISPTVAPSGCFVPYFNMGVQLKNEKCSGATGNGVEADHNIGLDISGDFNKNGTSGIYICGGRNVTLGAIQVNDNGQYVNYPITQYAPFPTDGIAFNGTCTAAQPGTLSNVSVSNINASDDQATPTQTWGLGQWYSSPTLSNFSIAQTGIVAVGNTAGAIQSVLLASSASTIDNRILNPCMSIDQANEGSSVSPGGYLYGPDQWKVYSTPSHMAYQKQSGAFSACGSYLQATVGSTYTPASTSYQYISQPIEAQNVYDLQFGQSSAKTLVYDFCGKASVAGTYSSFIQVLNGTNYSYVFPETYAANTLSCFSVLIPGNTLGAPSSTSTNAGLVVGHDLGSGSNSLTSSCNQWVVGLFFGCLTGTSAFVSNANSSTIQYSGERLYPATSDVPWLQRLPSVELSLVQRYYVKTFPSGTKPAQSAGVVGCLGLKNPIATGEPGREWAFPVQMRIAPTVTTYNPSAANANWRDVTGSVDVTVSVDPLTAKSAAVVEINTAAAVATLGDNLCIHGVADARF